MEKLGSTVRSSVINANIDMIHTIFDGLGGTASPQACLKTPPNKGPKCSDLAKAIEVMAAEETFLDRFAGRDTRFLRPRQPT